MVSLAKEDTGNRLTRTRVSDGYVTAYEWDHRNRLVSITELDDEETVLAETTHDYDAFNQWIRRTVDADGPGENDAVESLFAHHDGQIVYQFEADAVSDLTNRYLWNPSTIDQLLVDEVVVDLSTAGDLQFPLGDHLGTVRDIAEYDSSTDTTSVSNHIRYDSFGSLESETNSSIDLLFGFTSRPLDESTGLQNNLHRWYDSALGQWASEDPIGFAAGDANVRRYVSNSALLYHDPDGLQSVVPKPLPDPAKHKVGTTAFVVSGVEAFVVLEFDTGAGIVKLDSRDLKTADIVTLFTLTNVPSPGELAKKFDEVVEEYGLKNVQRGFAIYSKKESVVVHSLSVTVGATLKGTKYQIVDKAPPYLLFWGGGPCPNRWEEVGKAEFGPVTLDSERHDFTASILLTDTDNYRELLDKAKQVFQRLHTALKNGEAGYISGTKKKFQGAADIVLW